MTPRILVCQGSNQNNLHGELFGRRLSPDQQGLPNEDCGTFAQWPLPQLLLAVSPHRPAFDWLGAEAGRRGDCPVQVMGALLLDEVRSALRIVIVPNTVDSPFTAAAERDDYTSWQSGNVVLYVGRLGRAKWVFDILHAVPFVLASREDAVFLLAGDPDEAGILEEMHHNCAKTVLGDAVQLLGKVTGQAKLDLFRRSMLFVLPSRVDGLLYALLEAMAAGLPVVTKPFGAIPEIVEDEHHGFLIQPEDVKETLA